MTVPTNKKIAIALRYDGTGAPRVIAKGNGPIGAKIIEVARANNIPIEENELLAGALSNVDIGNEIPTELYKAVAEVLVFLLKLTRPARPGR
jgi:flagellar biosynthesis protein